MYTFTKRFSSEKFKHIVIGLAILQDDDRTQLINHMEFIMGDAAFDLLDILELDPLIVAKSKVNWYIDKVVNIVSSKFSNQEDVTKAIHDMVSIGYFFELTRDIMNPILCKFSLSPAHIIPTYVDIMRHNTNIKYTNNIDDGSVIIPPLNQNTSIDEYERRCQR
jgi:hypothetical protein